MAYGIKYQFRLESIHGVLYTVNLLQDGFSGTPTVRPLGKSPLIRMQENDPFRTTSCDLTFECLVDGEFAELYTSDPREFQVNVYRGGSIGVGGSLIWTGFVATELYAEPDIAPPYDVNITATDGLGTLKEYDFPARGVKTVRDQIRYLLSQTGLSRGLYAVTTEQPNNGSPIDFFDATSIDLDYLEGENCYDVLSALLSTLHMTVTQYRGNWLLLRETDVSGKLNSSGTLSVYSIPYLGSTSATTTTTVSDVKKTIGQMGVADLWPVGYFTRRVSPAKKSVTVEAPWHMKNVLQNPDMSSDSEWQTGGMVWNSGGYYETQGQSLCYFYQDVGLTVGMETKYSLKIRASRNGAEQSYNIVAFGYLSFQATGSSTVYYYDSSSGKWGTSVPQNYTNYDLGTINTDPSLAEEFTMDVPALPFNNISVSGIFRVYIRARNANIFFVSLEQDLNAGFRDNLILNNGARGKEDAVTILGGRTNIDAITDGAFLQGAFVQESNHQVIRQLWRDARWSGKDFVSITALDYALSVAVPRIELTGILDFPSTLTFIPFVLDLRSVLFILKSYNWDLLNEEINFTALSVPAAALTVFSETITSLGD